MAIIRKTMNDIRVNPSRLDHARLKAATEPDIRRYSIEDGENPDASADGLTLNLASAVRASLGMTQVEASRRFKIPVSTWRNWEQNRVKPDAVAQTLLTMIWNGPKQALDLYEKKKRVA